MWTIKEKSGCSFKRFYSRVCINRLLIGHLVKSRRNLCKSQWDHLKIHNLLFMSKFNFSWVRVTRAQWQYNHSFKTNDPYYPEVISSLKQGSFYHFLSCFTETPLPVFILSSLCDWKLLEGRGNDIITAAQG